MLKFTAATFPSQPTASGVTLAGKQVGHVCQALRNTLFSAYFLEEGKTTFPCNKASNTSRDRAKAGSRPFLSESLREGLALVQRVWRPPPRACRPPCPRCCCCRPRGWRCGWRTPPCPGTRWSPCAGAAPASSWTWAGSWARSQPCSRPPDGWSSWWCLGWRCEPGPAGCERPPGLQPKKPVSRDGEMPPGVLPGKVLFAHIKPGHLNSLLGSHKQLHSAAVNSDKLCCNFPNKI